MKKKLGKQIFRVLLWGIGFYVASLFFVRWPNFGELTRIRKTRITLIRLKGYNSALQDYNHKYGTYPYSCTNIEELTFVLAGHHLRDCNSNSINFFFTGEAHLNPNNLIFDAYGRRLVLIRNVDGTNLTIQATETRLVGSKEIESVYCEINTLPFKKQNTETNNDHSIEH